MFSKFANLALAIARLVLPVFVKNPKSVAKEEVILSTAEVVVPVVGAAVDKPTTEAK